MTLDKLEMLVSVMTNDQYDKFQNAVLKLITDNGVFSLEEIKMMEKKMLNNQKKDGAVVKQEYGITMIKVPSN